VSERAGFRPGCRICGDHYADMPHCYEPEEPGAHFEEWVIDQFRLINQVLRADSKLDKTFGELLRKSYQRDTELFVCMLITLAIALYAVFH